MSRFTLSVVALGLAAALGGCAGGVVEPMNEPMVVAPRGDNPNLPLPETPTAATENPAVR